MVVNVVAWCVVEDMVAWCGSGMVCGSGHSVVAWCVVDDMVAWCVVVDIVWWQHAAVVHGGTAF